MLTITAPIAPELAARYRAAGWWNDRLLRDGIESAPLHTLALADAEVELTYGELRERVGAAIGFLQRAGVGNAAVLVAGNTAAAAVAYHALLRIGATVVVLDRRCGAVDLKLARETAGATAPVIAHLAELHRLGVVGIDLKSLMAAPAASPAWSEPDRDRPAVVLFTSGTTSRPKGVIHSLNTLTAGARNMALLSSAASTSRAYLVSPLTSIAGIIQLHTCADQHAALILDDAFEPVTAVERLHRYGATLLGGAPVIVERLFDAAAPGALRLRTVALGGAALPRPLLERAIDQYGIEVVRVYGSSEAPNHTASQPSDDLATRLADDGALLPGSEVKLGAGSEGLVRGPARFLGYTEPADNEHSFERDGWFRTGDALELNGERVAVVGRLKEVVNRAGLKISLAEIDAALSDLPGVSEAAAFGLPDAGTGERLAVAAVGATTLADVVAHLRAQGLATRKLPEECVRWDAPLPRTPSGKIVRARVASESAGRPTERNSRITKES